MLWRQVSNSVAPFVGIADERVKYVETIPVITYLKDLVLPFNFDCDFVTGVGCAGCAACASKITKEIVAMSPRVPVSKIA